LKERARLTEENGPRTVTDVFASPAPPVLDMYTYLEQRRQEALTSGLGPSHSDRLARDDLARENSPEENGEGESAAMTVTKVLEEVIEANRMSEEEIRALPGGKFLNYTPGIPSSVSDMILARWLSGFLLTVFTLYLIYRSGTIPGMPVLERIQMINLLTAPMVKIGCSHVNRKKKPCPGFLNVSVIDC